MKLAIMQPYLFPYIGYFQLINAADKFIIYDDVCYINRGWINRNSIIVNGEKRPFNFNLKKASQNKYIKDIELSNYGENTSKFLKTIYLSYKKAPYFENVYCILERIFSQDSIYITDLIILSLQYIFNYIGVTTEIAVSSKAYTNQSLKAEDRILDICEKENARIYINPIGGMGLYSKEHFNSKGIELRFLNPRLITYNQSGNEFIPWLSIIDVMMNNSQDKIKDMLEGYDFL